MNVRKQEALEWVLLLPNSITVDEWSPEILRDLQSRILRDQCRLIVVEKLD